MCFGLASMPDAAAEDADALYAEAQIKAGTDEAKFLLKKACELDHVEACKAYASEMNVAIFFGDDLSTQEQFWAYGRACDLGDGEACVLLGNARTPIGMFGADRNPENWAGAVAAYKRACEEHEIAEACAKLSDVLSHGSNPERDASAGRAYRQRACEMGYETSCGSSTSAPSGSGNASTPAEPATTTSRSARMPEPQTPTRAYVDEALMDQLLKLYDSDWGSLILSTKADFDVVSAGIIADNQVSDEEYDLIQEIMYRYDRPGASTDPIRLRWTGTEDAVRNEGRLMNIFVHRTFRQNVRFEELQALLDFEPVDLAWNDADRPGTLRQLFETSLQSPAMAETVKPVISAEVAKLAAASTVENAYKPFRGLVMDGMNVINEFEGDDNAALRTLFHDAIEDGVAGSPVTIPRFLYNWIDPVLGIAPPPSANTATQN
nr:hypothetical protein GCM10011355_12770 [Aquisalinus luteolus]